MAEQVSKLASRTLGKTLTFVKASELTSFLEAHKKTPCNLGRTRNVVVYLPLDQVFGRDGSSSRINQASSSPLEFLDNPMSHSATRIPFRKINNLVLHSCSRPSAPYSEPITHTIAIEYQTSQRICPSKLSTSRGQFGPAGRVIPGRNDDAFRSRGASETFLSHPHLHWLPAQVSHQTHRASDRIAGEDGVGCCAEL